MDGISAVKGLSTYYEKEAELDRIMIAQANITIIAVDYTKIGRTAFAKIVPVSAADYMITNKNAPKDEIDALGEYVNNIIEI